jgi:hypothetical protein
MLIALQRAAAGLCFAAATAGLFAQFSEDPHTVAPGKFLLEMDALKLSVKHEDNFKYTALGLATATVTTGITASLDVQVLTQVYLSQQIETAGFTDRRSGIGDIEVRTKWKFYDEGGTAVAVLPYIKFPTSSDGVGSDAVEGGIIVPWSTQLPTGFTIVAQGELAYLRNPSDTGYDTHVGFAGYVSHPIIGGLGAYAEAVTDKSAGGEPFVGYMGAGVTLAVGSHASWDYALYKGITDGADDWNTVLRFNYSF